MTHKQSTPRACEGLPAGAARLGRAALQNRNHQLLSDTPIGYTLVPRGARTHGPSMDSTASEMGMMGALRTGNMVFDMIIAMTVPYIFKLLMGTPLTPS